MLRRATAADLDAVVGVQQAAYTRNRTLLGVEPIPLQADYRTILSSMDVWLAGADGRLDGVLILETRPDDLLIWSIAVDPKTQTLGLGRRLLAAAEDQARAAGRSVMRLYTGTRLTHLVDWYGRHGYTVERIETLSDRSITHMMKPLTNPGP